MARITTEHGKGYEYVLNAPMGNLNAFASVLSAAMDIHKRRGITCEHTLRCYKEKIEICKFSDFKKNRKFRLYRKEDIAFIRKGISFFPLPFLLIAFFVWVSIVAEVIWLVPLLLLLLPFCFGRCLVIKPKKGRRIKMGYSVFSDKELIERIMANY